MNSVVSDEARPHLPQLLERVAGGERILITDGGRPVAMLVPADGAAKVSSADVGRAMLAYRDQMKRTLGGSVRELARDGHRY